MNESTKLNPCAVCAGHFKPVLAIFLIMTGVILLGREAFRKKTDPLGNTTFHCPVFEEANGQEKTTSNI